MKELRTSEVHRDGNLEQILIVYKSFTYYNYLIVSNFTYNLLG